jgi:hypothetical protein
MTPTPWEPLEMSTSEKRTSAGDLVFYREYSGLAAGEYQYKFRLGTGDWWVVDESAETVSDGAGNRNNLLVVKEQKIAQDEGNQDRSEDTPEATHGQEENRSMPETPTVPITVVDTVADQEQPIYGDAEPESLEEDQSKREADAEPDAAFEHKEAVQGEVPEPADIMKTSEGSVPSFKMERAPVDLLQVNDDIETNATLSSQDAPLQAHKEHTNPLTHLPPIDTARGSTQASNKPYTEDRPYVEGPPFDGATILGNEAFTAREDDPEGLLVDQDSSPLLPHERVPDPDEVPLMPHESSTSQESLHDDNHHTSRRRRASYTGSASRSRSHTPVLGGVEGDTNDPSLESFPSGREEIFEQIQRTEMRLEEDEVREDGSVSPNSTSPQLSPHRSPLRESSISPVRIPRTTSSVSVGSSSLNAITEEDGQPEIPRSAPDHEITSNLDGGSAPTGASSREETHNNHSPNTLHTEDAAAQISHSAKAIEPASLIHPSQGKGTAAPHASKDEVAPPTPPMTPKTFSQEIPQPLSDPNPAVTSEPTSTTTPTIMVNGAPRTSINPPQEQPTSPGEVEEITQNTPSKKPTQPDTETDGDNQVLEPAANTSTALTFHKSNESFLHTFWRLAFGSWLAPLGKWLGGLCGGQRKAT